MTAEWTNVARADDFPPGSCRTLDIDGVAIAVFNVDGHHHAIRDQCTHEAELLSGGKLLGDRIVCPAHGAQFSLLTGEALSPPAYEPVAIFLVRVKNGMVQVKKNSSRNA